VVEVLHLQQKDPQQVEVDQIQFFQQLHQQVVVEEDSLQLNQLR
jgi:hypothetical protein